jgi:Lon protease-like protein
MVDAALVGHRLIGMIQPAGLITAANTPSTPQGTDSPDLAGVGCAGRITGLQETEDGRYLIALTGISRFRVKEEIKQGSPYRIVRADWEAFAEDLNPRPGVDDSVRSKLIAALHAYLERSSLKADWSAVEDAPVDTLINSLSAGCPFSNPEKQALLEARTLEERCAALITLLQMESPGQGGGYVQ